MSIPFEQASIVIFDTETTGLDPAGGDRIVEIACMRLWGGETVAVFETLLNPQRAVSPGAFAVNHISAQMLADAPTFDVVSRQLLDFMRGSYVCSYNATFDMGFLAQELWRMGESVPADMMVMDFLKMARRLLPGMARYSLWFVAQQLGVAQEQIITENFVGY